MQMYGKKCKKVHDWGGFYCHKAQQKQKKCLFLVYVRAIA